MEDNKTSLSGANVTGLYSDKKWPIDDVLIGTGYCMIAIIDLILYTPIMIVSQISSDPQLKFSLKVYISTGFSL